MHFACRVVIGAARFPLYFVFLGLLGLGKAPKPNAYVYQPIGKRMAHYGLSGGVDALMRVLYAHRR